eukprot:1127807-Rhodomonas_salina.1
MVLASHGTCEVWVMSVVKTGATIASAEVVEGAFVSKLISTETVCMVCGTLLLVTSNSKVYSVSATRSAVSPMTRVPVAWSHVSASPTLEVTVGRVGVVVPVRPASVMFGRTPLQPITGRLVTTATVSVFVSHGTVDVETIEKVFQVSCSTAFASLPTSSKPVIWRGCIRMVGWLVVSMAVRSATLSASNKIVYGVYAIIVVVIRNVIVVEPPESTISGDAPTTVTGFAAPENWELTVAV